MWFGFARTPTRSAWTKALAVNAQRALRFHEKRREGNENVSNAVLYKRCKASANLGDKNYKKKGCDPHFASGVVSKKRELCFR